MGSGNSKVVIKKLEIIKENDEKVNNSNLLVFDQTDTSSHIVEFSPRKAEVTQLGKHSSVNAGSITIQDLA